MAILVNHNIHISWLTQLSTIIRKKSHYHIYFQVTSSYMKSYSSNPYMRDPRSASYQAYYPNYAPQVAPPYQRYAEIPPVQKPVEYRHPTYQNTPRVASSGVQPTYQDGRGSPRVQPATRPYPTQVSPTYQSPREYRSPIYQKPPPIYQPPMEYPPTYQIPTGFVPPVTQKPVEYQPTYQTQKATILPVEYIQAYQKMPEFAPPTIQQKSPVEYLTCQKAADIITPSPTIQYQPVHQKIPDIESPIIQSLDYEPIVQKIVEYVTNQYQKPIESSVVNSKLQMPAITSLALESLNSLDFAKSDCSLKSSPSLDASVLNNLAIALQLLIVNNIINNPRSNSIVSINNLSDSLLESAYFPELTSPGQMSNANYLVSSSFGDDSIMSKGMLGLGSCGSGITPRANFNLMSPYEAIASSPTPFSEPSPSLFALKNNFQSPYAAMIAADNNKDLFSISDLF